MSLEFTASQLGVNWRNKECDAAGETSTIWYLCSTNALVHKKALLPQKAWTIIQMASLDGTSSSAFSFIDDFKVSYQTETDSPQESSSA